MVKTTASMTGKNPDVVRSVGFAPGALDQLREIAAIEKRPVSFLVREAVAAYIEQWKARHPDKVSLILTGNGE